MSRDVYAHDLFQSEIPFQIGFYERSNEAATRPRHQQMHSGNLRYFSASAVPRSIHVYGAVNLFFHEQIINGFSILTRRLLLVFEHSCQKVELTSDLY